MTRARAAQRGHTILRRACEISGIALAASLAPAVAHAQPETEPPQAVPEPPVAPPATAPPPTVTTPPPPALETAAPPPSADEDLEQEEHAEGHERTLLRHRMLFPAYVRSSVVVSYVGLRERLGITSIDNLPTPAGRTDLQLATFEQGIDLGIKATDWLGVVVTGGARSLVGTNIEALTYQGATYAVGGGGGLVARVFRSDRTGSQLSLRLTGAYQRGQVAALYPLFDRPIQSVTSVIQGDLGLTVKTPFTAVSGDGAIAFAQGVSRLFGIQLSASVGYGHVAAEPYDQARLARFSTTNDELIYSLAAAPSFDLNAFDVPIAVMPEYILSRQASSADVRGAGQFSTSHQLALGVYYTGRVNLQVGLVAEAQLGLAPVVSPVGGESDSPMQEAAEIIFRYVW